MTTTPPEEMTARERVKTIVDLLSPVADEGNLWANGWKLRLALAQLGDEAHCASELFAFKESMDELIKQLAWFIDWFRKNGWLDPRDDPKEQDR